MGKLMHLCKRCTISVDPSLSHCPVCGTFIAFVDLTQFKKSYPTPDYKKIKQRQTRLLLSLLSIPFFIGLLVSIGIDIFLIQTGFSSLMLMSYFIFYGYIILFETILKDNTIGTIFLYHALAIFIGMFLFPSLSLSFDDPFRFKMLIPMLLIVLNVLFFIFAWIQRRSHLLLLQMFTLAVMSLVYGVLTFSIFEVDVFYLILSFSSLINILFSFTFFRKDFVSFLSRWLHI